MKKRISFETKRIICGYIFTLPFIIGFFVFMLYPLISNLRFSLGEITDPIKLTTKFIGFDNYIKLFREDIQFVPGFMKTIQQTLIWTPFKLVFALFMAIVLNRKLKGKGLFRVIFFLPVLLAGGYAANTMNGVILGMPPAIDEFIIETFNPTIAGFLNNLLTEILSNLWNSGVQVVIFLSGLQGISDTYYEASKIDGANALEQFWKITLPMLSPVILLNVIYTIIDSFRSPDNPIANLIVNTVFGDGTSGTSMYAYGSAMGWVYFSVVMVAVGLIFLLSRKMVRYEK